MRFDQLGTRIKEYESLVTSRKLMKGLPVYARIDGRSFHTFCRGLNKPFCMELVETMQEVTKFLVEETNAKLGYVQSDEISLCWLDVDKAPFEGKLHKLESVLASLATSKFINYIFEQYYKQSVLNQKKTEWITLFQKCQKIIPSFDCRVFQLPNEMELANTFVWREIDAVRNSIQMVAQDFFGHAKCMNKNSKELITMLENEEVRWNELPDCLKRGAYFHRVLVEKELDDETWDKIPDNKKPESRVVTRSIIERFEIPEMKNIVNKVGVYFYGEEPRQKRYPVWFIENKTMGYETKCPVCKKKHFFSTAYDTIPCRCGARLVTTKMTDLTSLDNYDTLIKEYNISGETND